MTRLLPLLADMTQTARRPRAGAALLIAILAVVLFTGPPASAQSENEGLNQVTVWFASPTVSVDTHSVDEGGTKSIGVYLSDDPGREVTIPITATGLGGASPADYSGVPQTVTFSREEECFDDDGETIEDGICYETVKWITITAARDADDDGEGVRLGFGAPLPAGVSAGRPATATVTINDGGKVYLGLAQVGIGVTADLFILFRSGSNEAWQWQRSATEYGAYSDIPAAEGGTSNPYTPSAGDLGMWLKAKVTYDVGSRTGQTAQATTVRPVLSQAALSNAGFAHHDELGYLYKARHATAIRHLYAQGFTTGSDTSGYLLTAVRLSLFARELSPNLAGTWAVHADDAGKPAAEPLSAARPILNADIPIGLVFTFQEFTHPDGVRVDPDTKYWIVISQTTPGDDGVIGIAAWGEWTGALEEGLATPPVDPGSGNGWSVDFRALTYYWDDPDNPAADDGPVDEEGNPIHRELLPWQTFARGLDLPPRFVLRMALRVAPEVTVQFSQDSYTVAEGGTQSVTVILSADPERPLVIPITTTGEGGATSTDYSAPTSVTFNAGETSKSFTFAAPQDALDDDDESVKLGFGTMPDAWVSAGTTDETTVSITDDDDPFVTVKFGASAYTVAESDDTTTPGVTENEVEVTVTLSADPERTVTIPITKANQDGASSADYSVPSSVVFASGETEKSITFTAVDDALNDDGERVQLGFGSLPDRVSAGAPAETTVNITDDDVPAVTVSFEYAAYTVAEGGTVEVTVTLSADPGTHASPFPSPRSTRALLPTTTTAGVPESVTFQSGETEKTITFMAVDDTEDEDGESVRLAFGALPGAVLPGSHTEATMHITDDVPAVTVSFFVRRDTTCTRVRTWLDRCGPERRPRARGHHPDHGDRLGRGQPGRLLGRASDRDVQ